jgi:hypothetical protein
MNTHNEDENVIGNSAYNPFPEPQTIPSGWDLSGMLSTSQTDSNMNEDESAESENY